jgi:hypothetical protein
MHDVLYQVVHAVLIKLLDDYSLNPMCPTGNNSNATLDLPVTPDAMSDTFQHAAPFRPYPCCIEP